MFGGAFIGLMGLLVLSTIQAQQQQQQPCGRLRQWQLYNRREITDPDEYPWLGRIGYSSTESEADPKEYRYLCLAVLLSERHAILPAHCIGEDSSMEATTILFGDWRSNQATHERDCLTADRCAPPPESYTILELAIHPQYDRIRHDHDIALAKLDRNVRFGDFVQPICLPPDHEVEGNHIGQRLEMVGFLRTTRTGGSWRLKRQVHTLGSNYCSSHPGFAGFNQSSNHICGLISSTEAFMSGSPMMGVNVVDGNPDSFYLIATAIFGVARKREIVPDGFMRIYPFREWIVRNMM
ncbi:CLIP domain-containing serine protease 2-like [Drosophila miranda]|uniref:CLIP domain-containing serine protease 2-like n=1 Tax=Drosophila miranda TaxID=7229 RepID=UPI0007E75ABC|nr:CLIP domain-containing serine protease 2-like [Drosophila miranda]